MRWLIFNTPRLVRSGLQLLLAIALWATVTWFGEARADAPCVTLRLPPSPQNPRNSEGDFVRLRDGRILFVYTHFYGGSGDHASARLVSRVSRDGGRSWSARDRLEVDNEGGMNIMSVSLLRLANGPIALFYLRKNSQRDCRPYMRTSRDEGATWSAARCCITDEVGYFVMNNDRAVELDDGRLILPVALHWGSQQPKRDWNGQVMCYLSDDHGATWRRSASVLTAVDEQGKRWISQEPGVVPLADGRLMLFCRSNSGFQFVAYSADRGNTWSALARSSIFSPLSPATIERVPQSDDLLMIWNDHQRIDPSLRGKRTPLVVALSHDQGRTWTQRRTLYDHPDGWYCYTALLFVDSHFLLGHCAGDRRHNNGLAETIVTRVPLAWVTAGHTQGKPE